MRLLFWRKPLVGACFKGVYLPAPDDPRWKYVSKTEAMLGKFKVYGNPWNQVYFNGSIVGEWKRYVKAVFEGELSKRSLDSLAELENAS
jgi:hypothetical protein